MHSAQPGPHLYRRVNSGVVERDNAHASKQQKSGFEPGLPQSRDRHSTADYHVIKQKYNLSHLDDLLLLVISNC